MKIEAEDEKSIAELCKPLSAKVESTRLSWGSETLGLRENQAKNAKLRRAKNATRTLQNMQRLAEDKR